MTFLHPWLRFEIGLIGLHWDLQFCWIYCPYIGFIEVVSIADKYETILGSKS